MLNESIRLICNFLDAHLKTFQNIYINLKSTG